MKWDERQFRRVRPADYFCLVRQTLNFFLQSQFLLFHGRNFKVNRHGRSQRLINSVNQDMMIPIQLLQMRAQGLSRLLFGVLMELFNLIK